MYRSILIENTKLMCMYINMNTICLKTILQTDTVTLLVSRTIYNKNHTPCSIPFLWQITLAIIRLWLSGELANQRPYWFAYKKWKETLSVKHSERTLYARLRATHKPIRWTCNQQPDTLFNISLNQCLCVVELRLQMQFLFKGTFERPILEKELQESNSC